MRTSGPLTPALKDTVRRHAATGLCNPCAGNAGSGRGTKFVWEPHELADAVRIGLAQLYPDAA